MGGRPQASEAGWGRVRATRPRLARGGRRWQGEAPDSFRLHLALVIDNWSLLNWKWDGKLPQFSAGGNTPGIFLNVPAPPAGRP
jgi:hypothetical protein